MAITALGAGAMTAGAGMGSGLLAQADSIKTVAVAKSKING